MHSRLCRASGARNGEVNSPLQTARPTLGQFAGMGHPPRQKILTARVARLQRAGLLAGLKTGHYSSG
jgi:hypothetical protein